MAGLTAGEIAETISRYADRFRQFGVCEKTLGWTHGRQMVRFEALTSLFPLQNHHILDIGCGFGDLNHLLQKKCGEDYRYTGMDLVPELVAEARRLWNAPHISFHVGDFSAAGDLVRADFAIASGVLNHRLSESDNYVVAEDLLRKALNCCSVGVAFDFLTDRVDYRLEHTFHYDPCRMMEIALRLSRRVVLRNDYLPFEFTVVVLRDDEVDRSSGRFMRASGCQNAGDDNEHAKQNR